MGWWSDLTGKTAAKTAEAASRDQYGKERAAIDRLLGYADEYETDMGDLYRPYTETGYAANDAYRRLLTDPSSVRSLPGYQFDMDQGVEALDRSAGSRGLLKSGRAAKDLLRFGQGNADKYYGDHLNRLLGGVGVGIQGAAGEAQGKTGALGARSNASSFDFNSAGTIGQGMVAGANARAAGLQGIMNAGGSLLGKIISPIKIPGWS